MALPRFLPMPVSASVIVTGLSTFDPVSNRFIYNYSVTNSGSAEEIIQVTFPVSASAALMRHHRTRLASS